MKFPMTSRLSSSHPRGRIPGARPVPGRSALITNKAFGNSNGSSRSRVLRSGTGRAPAFGQPPRKPFPRRPCRRSESGVALVVTLIMLSVIAFMSITFLILTQRERGSVTSAANQTDARLAADTALERAKSELMAPVIAFHNPDAYGLGISTNYISAAGFDNNPFAFKSPTNVNFEFKKSGGAPTPADVLQNLANLQYNPRVPVYVTNAVGGSNEFRYYLDLNRNGSYDPNGNIPVISPNNHYYNLDGTEGAVVVANTPPPLNVLYGNFPGDPEWIGILERPELPHSGTNKFVARYAYVTVPAGQTLDANYIHNQTAGRSLVGNDGFMRNQGVGSYEVNLAAFLADLNTNMWLQGVAPNNAYYAYNRPVGSANVGKSFEDAQALVRFRYDNNYPDIKRTVTTLFPGAGVAAFNSDPIDRYADGPLMTTLTTNATDNTSSSFRWPGAENPNHFFTLSELFSAPYLATFSNHLWQTGIKIGTFGVSSYDRSTYYRLLAQLGTESSTGLKDDADPSRLKVNLNYDNLVQPNSRGIIAATNFIPWRPADLFTNLADRLLRDLPREAYGDLSITNILIYPTNHYTPAVHRLLQLAANIYDATTNRVDVPGQINAFLPHVFRPAFNRLGTGTNAQIWISGYVEEPAETDPKSMLSKLSDPNFMIDLTEQFQREQIQPSSRGVGDTNYLVSGVPLIVGAKKGLPNFNEFALENALQVNRKLEFRRDPATMKVVATNQMYVFNIDSIFGVEAWNSYSNTYPRPLRMIVRGDVGVGATNENGNVEFTNVATMSAVMDTDPTTKPWTGFTNINNPKASFRIPLSNNVPFLRTNVVFLQSATGFEGVPYLNPENVGNKFPGFKRFVNLRTRLRFYLVDIGANRIVDYVSLDVPEESVDLASHLADNNPFSLTVPDITPAGGWRTNAIDGTGTDTKPSVGIRNQISISLMANPPNSVWRDWQYDPAAGQDKSKATKFFHDNLYYPLLPPSAGINISNVFYAPFTPARTIYQHVSWQANDPLVHYTASDLTDLSVTNVDTTPRLFAVAGTNTTSNLGNINTRYKPWGGNPFKSTDPSAYNLALKDPLVARSDDWEFPTNKLPNVGWIGRVHRGTPWQTVYLKSPDIINVNDPNSIKEWQKWTGNKNPVDAYNVRPVSDRPVFDHITTAPNDNASRGTLNVNQSGLAAWSAVLSGVVALTNDTPDASLNAFKPGVKPSYSPVVIEPAGAAVVGNVPVRRLVDSINATRASTNFNGSFKHLGDILAVPEFTVGAQTNYAGTFPNGYWTNASPFLNFGDPKSPTSPKIQEIRGLSDAAYERIPQQVMSLLRGPETRFVVYAYGQSLKPAERSIVQASGFSGMVTNYQITGEIATRSVVRIDGGTTNAHAVVESFNFLPPE